MTDTLTTVATNLAFPEGPRWHDGTLWWSDMHSGEVCRLVEGKTETICSVSGRPSGLGWLPDGRMLVVSMLDKRVLRREADGTLAEHADLSGLAPRRCNDMVVDSKGGAFIGNFGFDEEAGEKPCGTVLIRVEADGAARIVADELVFPNGMVITDGSKTLVVAETFAARLTAFDIDEAGNLSNRRPWASFDRGVYPDGICLDDEGAIWVACPATKRVVRVAEGGSPTASISMGRPAYACAIGGVEGRTLFVCTASSHDLDRQIKSRDGRIEGFAL
jgi:sugar lactone lactonase YvrE